MDESSVKPRKYSIIGNILLSILPKGESKYPLQNYFKTTSRKEIVKDFIYYGSFIGFVLFIGFIALNVEHLVVPQVTDPTTKVTVSGNCPFILDMYRNITAARRGQGYIISEDYNYTPPKQTLPIKIISTTPTCPSCDVCPTCPTIPDCVCTCEVCTKCPEPTTKLTEADIQWLLNDCQLKDGSPAFQGGSADTCDRIREYFNVPGRSKFKTRPSAAFYNPVKVVEKDCTVCFGDGDCDNTFYLNNSIWLISGNGSMKWIHKK